MQAQLIIAVAKKSLESWGKEGACLLGSFTNKSIEFVRGWCRSAFDDALIVERARSLRARFSRRGQTNRAKERQRGLNRDEANVQNTIFKVDHI